MTHPRSDAFQAGLRLLSQRDRGRAELLALLERRGFAAEEARAAAERLASLGYLDDERFARARARTLLEGGRFGAAAVVQRLVARGLAEPLARRAAEEAAQELGNDPLEAARALLAARGLGGARLDPRQRARGLRLLTLRGFDADVVAKLLGDPDLDPSPPED